MGTEGPRVSIGVPVYNGEEYLEEALSSALNQTFSGFEIIISDNASTDRTQDICAAYAKRDPRVSYFRNEENEGASANYRIVFELSSSDYFCWLPCDEAMEPGFLERCVEMLDQEADVVLAFPRYLHRTGSDLARPHPASRDSDLRHSRARERVSKLIRNRIIGPNWPIFGLYRRSTLARTQLIRPVIGADDYLTLEMALRGQMGQIPEELYVLRSHPGAWHQARHKKARGLARWFKTESVWAAAWFDPANRSMKVVFPHWRRIREFFLIFVRSDETIQEKIRLVGLLPVYASQRWRRLGLELVAGALQLLTMPFNSAFDRFLLRRGPTTR